VRASLARSRGCASLVVVAAAAFSFVPTQDVTFALINQQTLVDGMLCPVVPNARQVGATRAAPPATLGGDIPPIRVVEDPYPVPASLAIDPVNDLVVVSDENRFSLLTYDRRIAQDGVAEPRRTITGFRTNIELLCGVAVDPARREIYAVNNDSVARTVVFSYDQHGNVAPARQVDTGKAWGLFLDLANEEMVLANQHENRILFYRKLAAEDEAPLRIIQGPATGLADPHGVHVDARHGEVVVTNYGSYHPETTGDVFERLRAQTRQILLRPVVPSGGAFDAPSVRVYTRTANGNVAPLRTIQGPSTRLNLPGGVWVDAERGEILVANDGGDSILVFGRTANGDAAPIRTIEGVATGLKNPTSVVVDPAHGEMWASNWGDHSATVYPRGAGGNVKPLRTIRTAPERAPTPGMGNPSAVTYDPIREQILVPN
jgi:DNA-binding beta-propeller fold protein YncE